MTSKEFQSSIHFPGDYRVLLPKKVQWVELRFLVLTYQKAMLLV